MEEPDQPKKGVLSKREAESLGEIEEQDKAKVNKVEPKEEPKKQAKKETVNSIYENLLLIQDIAKFIGNPGIPNDKRGQYAIQLNTAIMGEAARQIVRLLEVNGEFMPRVCKEMPWQTLIYLRTACSHQAHLQNLDQLIKAIRVDIPVLEKTAGQIMSVIDEKKQEKKEYEREPLKLPSIEVYSQHIKEIGKGKKKEKSKDESRQDENIDKLSKQVKGLKLIIDELNNIQSFLKSGNDIVTIYAIQMAIARAGLAALDRLDKKFQDEYPLDIKISGSPPFTWKSLISSRELTIHKNSKMNPDRTMKEAMALQRGLHFFQGLYEQQNTKLMKLKTEFQQKKQVEKILGSKETEKEQSLDSTAQPTALLEVREPFKMSFSLSKPQPKIKAAAFIKPTGSPLQAVSGTLPANQNNPVVPIVKEEERKPGLGKKT